MEVSDLSPLPPRPLFLFDIFGHQVLNYLDKSLNVGIVFFFQKSKHFQNIISNFLVRIYFICFPVKLLRLFSGKASFAKHEAEEYSYEELFSVY